MKRKLRVIFLALSLMVLPFKVYASEEVEPNSNGKNSYTITQVKDSKDDQIIEQIQALIEEINYKLKGLEYIKEKMPNTMIKYGSIIEKAERDARSVVKAAEEFLYGKKDEIKTDKEKVNPENNSEKDEVETDKRPQEVTDNKGGGFRDPNSPAYLEAKGRIIGNVNSGIYHLPDGAFYKKVSIGNAVFFNTEKEAKSAGYRKSLR